MKPILKIIAIAIALAALVQTVYNAKNAVASYDQNTYQNIMLTQQANANLSDFLAIQNEKLEVGDKRLTPQERSDLLKKLVEVIENNGLTKEALDVMSKKYADHEPGI